MNIHTCLVFMLLEIDREFESKFSYDLLLLHVQFEHEEQILSAPAAHEEMSFFLILEVIKQNNIAFAPP